MTEEERIFRIFCEAFVAKFRSEEDSGLETVFRSPEMRMKDKDSLESSRAQGRLIFTSGRGTVGMGVAPNIRDLRFEPTHWH